MGTVLHRWSCHNLHATSVQDPSARYPHQYSSWAQKLKIASRLAVWGLPIDEMANLTRDVVL